MLRCQQTSWGCCSAALSHAWQTCQASGAGQKQLSLVVQHKHSHCRQDISAAKHCDTNGASTTHIRPNTQSHHRRLPTRYMGSTQDCKQPPCWRCSDCMNPCKDRPSPTLTQSQRGA